MKSGERLVWAAAFAQVIASSDKSNVDPEYLQSRVATAVVAAHTTVEVLRRLSAESMKPENKDGKQAEAWAMVRDMAGATN